MAFIKRSTVTPVNAKVGKQMRKCVSCGNPIVSKSPTNLCQNCTPRTVSVNDDGTFVEGISDFDVDVDVDVDVDTELD